MHILFDAVTGKALEKLAEPSNETSLPRWAKSRLQVQIDSVDSSPALSEGRTKWIMKVLWQTSKIRPGMKRSDLLTLYGMAGGFHSQAAATFVLKECAYIQMDVRFKAGSTGSNDDIIESVSKPYLDWMKLD